jgi:hypothetical protein
MQNTTQKTNQRMPGRSAEVVGNELRNGPGSMPSAQPLSSPAPAPAKPAIKLKHTGPIQSKNL